MIPSKYIGLIPQRHRFLLGTDGTIQLGTNRRQLLQIAAALHGQIGACLGKLPIPDVQIGLRSGCRKCLLEHRIALLQNHLVAPHCTNGTRRELRIAEIHKIAPHFRPLVDERQIFRRKCHTVKQVEQAARAGHGNAIEQKAFFLAGRRLHGTGNGLYPPSIVKCRLNLHRTTVGKTKIIPFPRAPKAAAAA